MELRTRTLGDICDDAGGEIKTGPFGSQLHQSDYSENGTPVVMPKNIIDGTVSVADIARIADQHVERLSQHCLKVGDIVYGRRGDIGRHALIKSREDGWLCGTGCLRITAGNGELQPNFLHYYLDQDDVKGWILNQAVGATMPNLNTTILRSVPVTYPSRESQRKIAAILSAYDDLIENNLRRIKILEEIAQNLYREWFVKFRFPGHANVRMVDSPLGKIPEGWEIVSIDDVATVHRGRSYRSKDLVDDGGLPFVNLKCIDRDGGFRRNGVKRYVGKYGSSAEFVGS
ncbi:restriction endonuclease subunit S [Thiolapillus sp.]|uniref:restriction endonuclease subunit S n=1 Tax=Thiolapillus sp. TaxID=2017437 RepID=UPI0025FA1961|nr:restriction endonuclease subunit S [Thiolapillus sp.]